MGNNDKEKIGFFRFGRKKPDDDDTPPLAPPEPPVITVEASSEADYLEGLRLLGLELERTSSKLKTYTVAHEEVDTATGQVEYFTVYGTYNPGGRQLSWRESHGVFDRSDEGRLRNELTALDRSQAVRDFAIRTGGNFWSYPASPNNLGTSLESGRVIEITDRARSLGITPFPPQGQAQPAV